MGKTYIDTIKYVINVEFEVDGIVEKPDVVGAIFGQTEGLLGSDLDLRDIQKNGRIGRIEVELKIRDGKSSGTIEIPSSLDMVETSIIAAALETVERVGPFIAKMKVKSIEDTRGIKRKYVIERAKELLKDLLNTEIPDTKELLTNIRKEVKTEEIVEYGKEHLPAGPGIDESDSVIFVEGRADVLNLLRNDIHNVIAIGGVNVAKSAIDLSKRKETTVFLDGDRGGDIILKTIIDKGGEVDYIARAPAGKEVEELSRKEIIKALRSKIPFEQEYEHPKQQRKPQQKRKQREQKTKKEEKIEVNEDIKKKLMKELDELDSQLKARFYDKNMKMIKEAEVRNLIKTLENTDGAVYVVFDGIVTQRLIDLAEQKGILVLAAFKKGHINKESKKVEIITKE